MGEPSRASNKNRIYPRGSSRVVPCVSGPRDERYEFAASGRQTPTFRGCVIRPKTKSHPMKPTQLKQLSNLCFILANRLDRYAEKAG